MLAILLDFCVCNTKLYHWQIECMISMLDLDSGHCKILGTTKDLGNYLVWPHVLYFAKQSKQLCHCHDISLSCYDPSGSSRTSPMQYPLFHKFPIFLVVIHGLRYQKPLINLRILQQYVLVIHVLLQYVRLVH